MVEEDEEVDDLPNTSDVNRTSAGEDEATFEAPPSPVDEGYDADGFRISDGYGGATGDGVGPDTQTAEQDDATRERANADLRTRR